MSTILDKSEPDYRSVKVKNKSQNDGNTAAGAHDSDEFHLKCFTSWKPSGHFAVSISRTLWLLRVKPHASLPRKLCEGLSSTTLILLAPAGMTTASM